MTKIWFDWRDKRIAISADEVGWYGETRPVLSGVDPSVTLTADELRDLALALDQQDYSDFTVKQMPFSEYLDLVYLSA